jgi:hypothetical protein
VRGSMPGPPIRVGDYQNAAPTHQSPPNRAPPPPSLQHRALHSKSGPARLVRTKRDLWSGPNPPRLKILRPKVRGEGSASPTETHKRRQADKIHPMNITAIQAALRDANLDAWLFYDHHHRDPSGPL